MIYQILPDGGDDPAPYPIGLVVEALENMALDLAWENRKRQADGCSHCGRSEPAEESRGHSAPSHA